MKDENIRLMVAMFFGALLMFVAHWIDDGRKPALTTTEPRRAFYICTQDGPTTGVILWEEYDKK